MYEPHECHLNAMGPVVGLRVSLLGGGPAQPILCVKAGAIVGSVRQRGFCYHNDTRKAAWKAQGAHRKL